MIVVFATLLQVFVVAASHFRGGTVSSRHVTSFDGDIQEVAVNFRLGWRRSGLSSLCDDTYIATQKELYRHGSLKVISGTPAGNFTHPAFIKCTTFDAEQDWVYGFNSFRANVSKTNPFIIQYKGSAWMDSLIFGAGGDWSVRFVSHKSGVRSDTGSYNHPPSTFSSPIIRLQRGCPSDVRITYNDDDNDNVTCRYAVGKEECGDVCGSYSSFSLNQRTCEIHYDGQGATVLVAVALILEDFPLETILVDGKTVNPSDYMSQVPLQFIVKIETTTDCNVRPSFPPKSIPEGVEFVLRDSGSFNRTIYASPSQQGLRITTIVILGPLGMQKTPIEFIGNDTFTTNVTWQPTKEQTGKHDVCYYAVDGNGKTSDQRCFVLTVSDKMNTCEIDNGGCSDICIPGYETNTCACSKPCWELDTQGRICLPRTNISCTGSEVKVEVDGCATDDTVVAGTNVDDFQWSQCQSRKRFSKQQLIFMPTQCGTELEMSATGIKYSVKMWTWHHFGNSVNSSTIVRGEWRIVRLSCSFPRSHNMTSSFLPLPSLNEEIVPETVVVDGMGIFQLHFDFYKTSKFESAYSKEDYPLISSLDKSFHVELRAEGRSDLELFVKQCIATTPKEQPNSLDYALIENGCVKDDTILFHPSSTTMKSRFSFQAFEFQENVLLSRSNYAVDVTCEVIICDMTVNNTRCSQGCLPRRQKRSVDDELGIEFDDDDDIAVTSVYQSPPREITRQIQFVSPEEKVFGSVGYIKWIMIGACNVTLLLALYLIHRIVKTKRTVPEFNVQTTSTTA